MDDTDEFEGLYSDDDDEICTDQLVPECTLDALRQPDVLIVPDSYQTDKV